MDEQLVLIILKVAFMVFFLGLVIGIGILPLRSPTFKTNKFVKAMGTTFAGALFINVSLLHILPQSANTLQDYLHDVLELDPDQQVFPLANLLVMLGFSITIFFTRIMSQHSHSDEHHHQHQHSVQTKNNSLLSGQIQEGSCQVQQQYQTKQTYFLTIAMYFHTIFQGIAIGVQDSLGGFLSTAIAIAFHKWADALSMGINYRNRNIPTKTAYILIIGQAVLNVASIGAGWIISNQGPVVQAIFLSISAGTFLAISTMQMLGEQLHNQQYKFYKFGIIIFSILFISAVWFLQNTLFDQENSYNIRT